MRHLRIDGYPRDRLFSRRAETLVAYFEHLGFLAGFFLDSHDAECCNRFAAGPERVTPRLRARIDAHQRLPALELDAMMEL